MTSGASSASVSHATGAIRRSQIAASDPVCKNRPDGGRNLPVFQQERRNRPRTPLAFRLLFRQSGIAPQAQSAHTVTGRSALFDRDARCRQEPKPDRPCRIALSVGPGIVDRFDHVAGPQGDVALDVLDLDGLRGQAADPVYILLAFHLEPLLV